MERPSYKTCQKILLRVMEANHDTDEEELPTGWGDDNGETVASTGDCGTDNMVAKQIGDLRAWKDAKTGQSDAEKLKQDMLQKELQRVEHCAQDSLSAGQGLHVVRSQPPAVLHGILLVGHGAVSRGHLLSTDSCTGGGVDPRPCQLKAEGSSSSQRSRTCDAVSRKSEIS